MTRNALVLSLAIALGAAAAAEAQPAGIPPLPFYPSTTVAATMFVDNTSAAATDLNNPNGTPTKPRKTIPTLLPAGAVVEVRGGPYTIKTLTVSAQGTATRPAILRGVGNPVLQGPLGRLILAGTYITVQGFVLESVAINMSPTIEGVMIRSNTIRNYSPAGNSAAVAVNGRNVIVSANAIYNNGNSKSTIEIDIPGVFVMPGANFAWIISNIIHHNGSDGVLVGSQSTTDPWPENVYIGGNTIHEDRENGVDIKNARDVIVASNLIYGYQVSTSSAGEAIVTHYAPERIWIVNNRVYASNRGIVSTGANFYVVLGNVISNIRHSPYESYSPTNLYKSAGIITYATFNSYHVNNTIWASDADISLPGGIDRTEVSGNVLGAAAHHIGFGSGSWLSKSVVDHNLLTGMAPRFIISGAVQPCVAPACLTGDPKFSNAANLDYRPTTGSVTLDANLTSPLYQALEYLYGAKIRVDAMGDPRPVGAFDLGALEKR